MDNNPALWIPRVEYATEQPLQVLKSDSDKHTLKAQLEPWGEVCLQDMRWGGMKKKLSLFRRTSGRLAWDLGAIFADLGIPILEQLLYIEIRQKGLVAHTYQVSRWLDGLNLGQLARDRRRGDVDWLIPILEKACLVIARLHNAGYIHGDLKWSNLLYSPEQSCDLILMDLDHVRPGKSSAALGRDLARFILSVAEFNMPKRVELHLIDSYFGEFQGRKKKVERSLSKYLARKRGRYQQRGVVFQDS